MSSSTSLGIGQKPLITIRLGGILGRRFGRVHKLRVSTPGEAVRAISANQPEFRSFIERLGDRLTYFISTPSNRQGLEFADIKEPLRAKVITLRPRMAGAGGGFARILGGVALLAASFLIPGLGLGVKIAGIGLIAGGIAELMAPKPKKFEQDDRRTSSLSNNLAVAGYGEPVPIFLGGPALISGFKVASASIQSESF